MGKLDPAGVNLQAKGFREYLNKLERIEKQQRETFDKEFKGAGKSFEKVTRAAKDYEQQLNRTRQAQDKLARANQLNRNLAQLESRQRRLGGGGGGGLGLPGGLGAAGAVAGAIGLAKAIKDTSRESAEAAANFNAQLAGINNLAAGYGQSGTAIRAAMRNASQGVLSESAIILGANQALLLGVAQTPKQFEEITRTALILGRTMGLTATQSIEQFNTALGRGSTQILDNFGVSARAVNDEIERLSQAQFGVPAAELETAQRQALFLEAALKVAGEAAATIGEEAITAAGDFDRLTASAENLKIAFGEATLPLEAAIARITTGLNQTLAQLLVIQSSVIQGGGIGDFFTVLGRTIDDLPDITDILDPGAFDTFFENLSKPLRETDPDLFGGVREQFKELSEAVFGISFDPFEEGKKQIEDNTEALKANEEQVKALQGALRQAEQLELSFARAAEDAARRQGRQVEKLRKTQEKERDKFLADQIKDFDEFNTNLLKDIQSAQAKLNDARASGNDDRLREQAKLHRDLRQAQDRFNLSQIQSERRFQLSDTRLRAEGDILALQELRENRGLEVQENKENFNLEQSQRKEDGKEAEKERDRQRRETVQGLERDLADLQNSFGEKQAAFLADQDEEFRLLLAKQQEQRDAQQLTFREQAEDRRINQARQLEDLGRSLADQEDLTEQGAKDIAAQIEKVFGVEGVADNIFKGFSDRTESEFRDLFNTVSGIARNTASLLGSGTSRSSPRGTGSSLERPLQFQEGGVVPGPVGAPQAAGTPNCA